MSDERKAEAGFAGAHCSATEVNWAILYDDPDHPHELFTDEAAARETLKERQVAWSCHLFQRESPNDQGYRSQPGADSATKKDSE